MKITVENTRDISEVESKDLDVSEIQELRERKSLRISLA